MQLNKMKKAVGTIIDCKGAPTVMLWGPPGCGKSAIVKQITEERGIGMIDVRLLLLNPVDLRGLPVPDRENGVATWLSAGFLPRASVHGEKGILFMDEINAAAPSVQAAAYQLTLDRRCGEYRLPDGWNIVAAGNRTSDRGVVSKMPSPLANRMIHFEVEPNLDDWKIWAYQHKIHPQVISFLSYKAERLFTPPEKMSDMDDLRAFPTPRSWSFASQMLYLFGGENPEQLVVGDENAAPLDMLRTVLAGTIGQATAHEFITFYTVYRKLPNINTILTTGEGKVPEEPHIIYALCSSLVAHLAQSDKSKVKDRMGNFLKYLQKIPKEFQLWTLGDVMKADLATVMFSCASETNSWTKEFMPYLLDVC